MKKLNLHISQRSKMIWIGMVLCCMVLSGYSQFQTTIGFPYSTNEKSPGGLITLQGEYLVLGDNNNHPNSLYGIPDGDLQFNWLDNSGVFNKQSRMYGQYYYDEAAWIEKASWCSIIDAYIVASSSRKIMMLTMIDVNGFLIWSNSIGSNTSNYVLTSACVKQDANGFYILVGTRLDLSNGQNSIVAVQVDCNGNQIWNRVYIVNGYSVTATSVTAFDTSPGNQGAYYISGKASPLTGGNEEVIILKIGTNFGGFNFMNRYGIAPNTDDVGTCIQGRNAPPPNGGLWVSGYSDDINALKTSMMLRTDLNGTPMWVNNYDIIGGDEFTNHFEFAANGKLVMTGKASEMTAFQGTKSGDCKLMRMDAASGNTIDFTRIFFGNGFSSQGNRVEVTSSDEYFVTGQVLDVISPSQSSTNILALLTDAQGLTDTTCYYDVSTQIIPQMPSVNNIHPASITLDVIPDYDPIVVDTLGFTDQQTFCSFPPAICDFTWTPKNCFEVDFSGTIQITGFPPGVYQFTWDFDCAGPMPPITIFETVTSTSITSLTSVISHTFPCGGGPFNVCLTIEDPFGFQCNVMHTVSVPNTCCGNLVSANVYCVPDSNVYAFSIVYNNHPSVGNCSYSLTALSGNIVPGSLSFLPNSSPPGVMVGGYIFVPNTIPLNLNFILQSNCFCTSTGLPVTCSLPVSIPTICCKEIHVDDQIVCKYGSTASVPIQVSVWPPLNQVYSVSWYAIPKPPSGLCPPPPYPLYQSNAVVNSLTPLQLFPNQLPGDLCVYAEVQLNDGPCTILTSNIAMVQLCTPDSCMLNDIDSCYSGTCIVPGPFTLSLITHPDACPNTIEWFEPGNPNPVQIGGSSYQPTICLSMANDQNCYEDFYFTAVITDSCGSRSCQGRFRLYSNNAPDGTLVIDPSEPQFFCPAEDATLRYTPGCAGDPKKWYWFERPCLGGTPTAIQGTGDMNPIYNTNKLSQSVWYSVVSQNGVCPSDTVDLTIQVKDPLTITFFNAFSDPCVEQFVTMDLGFLPCTISGCGTNCSCTYTVDWYKDGFIIATTSETAPFASFTYTTLPLYGNYYAVLRSDCCDEVAATQVITFDQSCDPEILGPCFICDNGPVTLTANMVMFPNMPCPTFCTLEWFDGSGTSLGTGSSISVTQAGQYSLVSDCNGCIKTVYFNLFPCQSIPCGPVSIQELLPIEERPVHLFPNPTKGAFTVEWVEGAPDDTRMTITDPNGIILQNHTIPFGSSKLDVSVDGLPSGLYFIKIRSKDQYWTVAKLVKE